jgi:hypothetical protein
MRSPLLEGKSPSARKTTAEDTAIEMMAKKYITCFLVAHLRE